MTEKEAMIILSNELKLIDATIEFGRDFKKMSERALEYLIKRSESMKMAIQALEEIQQYREIGTVEECREAMEKQEAWACWCIQQPGEEKPIPLCECEGSYLTEIKVEGNSIDNPELLGGAE